MCIRLKIQIHVLHSTKDFVTLKSCEGFAALILSKWMNRGRGGYPLKNQEGDEGTPFKDTKWGALLFLLYLPNMSSVLAHLPLSMAPLMFGVRVVCWHLLGENIKKATIGVRPVVALDNICVPDSANHHTIFFLIAYNIKGTLHIISKGHSDWKFVICCFNLDLFCMLDSFCANFPIFCVWSLYSKLV